MDLLGMLGLRPRYCTTCGDAMVSATYTDGFSSKTGQPIVRSWWKCPRSDDDMAPLGANCHRPSPFACAIERNAYYVDHRPSRGACPHVRVSEKGDRCWGKDGALITGVA